jgi:MinD-like ATPase involved in chromosome partitioning or flagellar assembly
LQSGRFLGRGTLGSLFAARLRVVVNEVDAGARLASEVAGALAQTLGPRLVGAVARDPAVAEALACQQLLADYAPASRAAADLADIARVVDRALPVPAPAPMATTLWGAKWGVST